MTWHDVLWRDVIMSKEAIGGCAHAAMATRFREGGGGMLSSDLGEFHQACGAPLVAEVGIGNFVDRPVGGGDDEIHPRLLETRGVLGDVQEG